MRPRKWSSRWTRIVRMIRGCAHIDGEGRRGIRCGERLASGPKGHLSDAQTSSMMANKLISRLTGVALHDYGCTLKAYRREIFSQVRLYGEMHRFIPALASWVGGSICEVPVNHHPRRYGTSKYGLGRTIRVVLDLMTVKSCFGYSTGPMQMIGKIGLSIWCQARSGRPGRSSNVSSWAVPWVIAQPFYWH